MTEVAPYSKITHVFVVMLENRSFENMFSWSWIPGIVVPQKWNHYQGQAYASDPNRGAPLRMSTDLGHEFLDVLQQLTGQTAYPSGGPYPEIENDGFVANYATSTTEYPNQPPTSNHWGDVMLGFKTSQQLPVLQPLTKRDAAANSVVPLLLLTTPRTDCPTNLLPPAPLMKAARPPMTAEERAQWHAQPLPESGNLVGALWVLAKTHYGLSAGTPEDVATIQSMVEAIQTRGQAEEYAQLVMERVELARRQRELAASQEFAAITESRARETETPPPVE